ncbi:MAG TPA: Rdx family protein [Vicinamibacterales bacterium]|nr:Rdx family protein [Vicinamibacterales bacterium]
MPRAASLAAAIRSELGVEAKLTPGDRGVFDVARDGVVIFSKSVTGRFPQDEEILGQLRATP